MLVFLFHCTGRGKKHKIFWLYTKMFQHHWGMCIECFKLYAADEIKLQCQNKKIYQVGGLAFLMLNADTDVIIKREVENILPEVSTRVDSWKWIEVVWFKPVSDVGWLTLLVWFCYLDTGQCYVNVPQSLIQTYSCDEVCVLQLSADLTQSPREREIVCWTGIIKMHHNQYLLVAFETQSSKLGLDLAYKFAKHFIVRQNKKQNTTSISLMRNKMLNESWCVRILLCAQHHCRKCGQAVCGKCSSKRSTIPLMGFEFEVRVCDSCHESISDEEWVTISFCCCHILSLCSFPSDSHTITAGAVFVSCSRAPTATFHDSKHSIVYMHYEPTTGNLLTSGTDKIVKVWKSTRSVCCVWESWIRCAAQTVTLS